jgi:hypothetical protein
MTPILRSTDVVISTVILGILVLWSITLHTLGYHDTMFSYFYNPSASLLYFWGMIMAIKTGRQIGWTGNIGKMLGGIAFALASFGIADLVWGYYNVILKVSIPYPSWADLFFVLYYPGLIAACIYLLILLKTTITKRFLWEAFGFFVLSFLLVFFVLIRPTIPDSINLTAFFDITYPMGDVLILALAFLGFRISGTKIRSVLPLFMISIFLEVAADILFSYTTKSGAYFNGSYVDVLFILNAWFLILSIESIKQNFLITPRQA